MLGGGERDGGAGTGVCGLTVSQERRARASSPDATEATDASAALPQRISLAILFFAYWCVDIVSPALPAIQESLALSATSAGLVFSVFFAGRLIANLPAAWLVERAGPKWTAVAGSAALMLGSALAAVAVSGVLLAGSLLARVRAAVSRTGRTAREEKSVTVRQSRSGEVAAVAANLLVFVNYSIWVVSLPLLGAEKFGFDAGQVGLMLLFVNVVHLASAVPFGGIIRKAGGARALALGFGVGGAGMLLVPFAPSAPWLLAPMALYAIGQVAGNSSAGDLILHLGGGGGRAVGAVRLSSDIGLVAGPAAVGVLADAAGVTTPFTVLGVGALAALAAAVFLGRQAPPRRFRLG